MWVDLVYLEEYPVYHRQTLPMVNWVFWKNALWHFFIFSATDNRLDRSVVIHEPNVLRVETMGKGTFWDKLWSSFCVVTRSSHFSQFRVRPFSVVYSSTIFVVWQRSSIEFEIVQMSSAWAIVPSLSPAMLTPRLVVDIFSSRGSMTREKRMGDKTEPCLTPLSSRNGSDRELFIFTAQDGSEYQLSKSRQHLPFIPAWKIWWKRTLYSTESNAFSRS